MRQCDTVKQVSIRCWSVSSDQIVLRNDALFIKSFGRATIMDSFFFLGYVLRYSVISFTPTCYRRFSCLLLVASIASFKRVCTSVHLSVGPSVRPSPICLKQTYQKKSIETNMKQACRIASFMR